MNNLHYDGQFCYYKGMIYANGGLDVNTRINNKMEILRQQAKEQEAIDNWLITYSAFCD